MSGGGSGHEPLHGGFVGYGMLDAACPGEVFTSPVPDQMLAATKAVNGGAGVLHIVKNYTGDVLNFQMAAELADDEGIEVARVVINDDVAVQDSLYTAGRRGVGATVFVEKIAGALAEEGADLAAVAAVAARGQRAVPVVRRRADLVRGPRGGQADLRARRGRDRAGHRHPRRARPHPRPRCARPASSPRWRWTPSAPTCRVDGDLLVMVNGMGGTPLIELYVVFNEVRQYLDGHGGRIAAEPGRQLHHQPGDAGLLRHRLPAHRRRSPGCGTRRWTRPPCGGDASSGSHAIREPSWTLRSSARWIAVGRRGRSRPTATT